MWVQGGRRGVLWQAADHRPGRPQGDLLSWAPEDLQARDQAGAQALPHRGVCRCAQGGLHQVQNQSQEGQKACGEEMVLHSLRGIRPGVRKDSWKMPLSFIFLLKILFSSIINFHAIRNITVDDDKVLSQFLLIWTMSHCHHVSLINYSENF